MVDGTITSWSPCFQPKNSFYGKNELNLRWMIYSTHSIKILTSYKIRQLAFRKKNGAFDNIEKVTRRRTRDADFDARTRRSRKDNCSQEVAA